MRNVPRRLVNLNTRSPAGGASWQIVGSCSLAGGCTHQLSGFRVCSLCSRWCLTSQLPTPAAPLSPMVDILPLESQAQMNSSISCLGYDFFVITLEKQLIELTHFISILHTTYHFFNPGCLSALCFLGSCHICMQISYYLLAILPQEDSFSNVSTFTLCFNCICIYIKYI